MTEVKKKEEGQEVVGVVKVDSENITWEELLATHKTMAEDIYGLQVSIAEMTNANGAKIEANTELLSTVSGLMKTIKDTAEELLDIQNGYLKGRVSVSGVITDEDDIMSYIAGMQKYITVGEKIGTLTKILVTDIMVKLKMTDLLDSPEAKEMNEITNKG